ncbi:MAG TPA: hypothetical protein VN651_11270 [Gemmatimonadaceae bacterium]|jgi:hypothetical protein|nr:hypothetical protein [Gemmatimonadaceae bacterium]
MSATRTSSLIALATVAGALLVSGCASANGGSAVASSRRSAPCNLRSEDSLYVVGGPLYRDCGVDRPAHLVTSNVNPEFRVTGIPRTCYQATVEFVVSAVGAPEPGTLRVLSANDDQFADAMRVMVTHLRYSPGMKDGAAVRQIVTERRAAAVRTEVGQTPGSLSVPTSGSAPGSQSGSQAGTQAGSPTGSSSSAAAAAAAAVSSLGSRSAAPMVWGTSC